MAAHQLSAAREAADPVVIQAALGVLAESALLDEALPLLEERLLLCRELDDARGLQDCLTRLIVAREQHHLVALVPSSDDGTGPFKKELRRLVRETPTPPGRADVLELLALESPWWTPDKGVRLLRGLERLSRRHGLVDRLWRALLLRAESHLWSGEWEDARACVVEAERICRSWGIAAGLQHALGRRAWLLLIDGDEDPAHEMLGERERMRHTLGWRSSGLAIDAEDVCQWDSYQLVPRVFERGLRAARALGDEVAVEAWLGWAWMLDSDLEERLGLAQERIAICRRRQDEWSLRDAYLQLALGLSGRGAVGALLTACKRAEALSRRDGPDADQAAHVLLQTLRREYMIVRTLLSMWPSTDDAERLAAEQSRIEPEIEQLERRTRFVPDRTWFRSKFGVKGQASLRVDPAELTLRW